VTIKARGNSLYMSNLQPTAVHLTIDDKVIVGAWSGPTGNKVVIVMNKKGDHETLYKNGENNKAILV
jgi:hypothetical protein